MPLQPPHTDGIMTFTDAEIAAIKTKLQTIQAAFTPTDDQPVCDTFYIVCTYNKANVGKEINGDTAEALIN